VNHSDSVGGKSDRLSGFRTTGRYSVGVCGSRGVAGRRTTTAAACHHVHGQTGDQFGCRCRGSAVEGDGFAIIISVIHCIFPGVVREVVKSGTSCRERDWDQ
jgi:hypothetical protein